MITNLHQYEPRFMLVKSDRGRPFVACVISREGRTFYGQVPVYTKRDLRTCSKGNIPRWAMVDSYWRAIAVSARYTHAIWCTAAKPAPQVDMTRIVHQVHNDEVAHA